MHMERLRGIEQEKNVKYYSSLNLNVISFVLSVYSSALEPSVKFKQVEIGLLTSDELLNSLYFACKTLGSEVIFSLFFVPELSLRAVTHNTCYS